MNEKRSEDSDKYVSDAAENTMNHPLLAHTDPENAFLRENDFQDPGYRKRRTVWLVMASLTISFLAIIGIIAGFRAVEHAMKLPKEKPQFPNQYEASLTMHMPYLNLTEPIYVHVDEVQGLQRLSYYGGMDVYVFNRYGPSYQIVPRIKELICYEQGPTPLQHVFPNLSYFEPKPGQTYIGDTLCHNWEYKVFGEPNPDGLIGTYTFYADVLTNQPVRFHYIGHNTMLGGSHLDEYYVDYEYIREGPIAKNMFTQLPESMKCINDPSDDGPTANPLDDLLMVFPEGLDKKHMHFDAFKEKFGKVYENNEERTKRWVHYHKNLRFINSVNRQGLSYYLKINHLADFSHEEIMQLMGFHNRHKVKRPLNNNASYSHILGSSKDKQPENINWRNKNAVTKVKDQGSCGSCWAFGTTGAIEGALYVKTNKLVDLSQQNLMDCSWDEGNFACNGGLDFQAYKWIMKSGGLEATSTYGSYLNVDGFCHFNQSNAAVSLNGFVNVTGIDSLNDALWKIGPLSVSIDATRPSFYFYGGGYYNDPLCKSDRESLDHSVLAVGYITHNGQKYTIVKNSWSEHWGNSGYVFISQENNICGVATAATYPLIL